MMKIIVIIAALTLYGIPNLQAQDTTDSSQANQVSVRVDGLSCPFCAYGLEKKIKNIDGAKDVRIDVEKGLLSFSIQKGKTVTKDEIRKKVKQAGFTPREITFSETPKNGDEDKNPKM